MRISVLLWLLGVGSLAAAVPTADEAIAWFDQQRYPEAEAAFRERVKAAPGDAQSHFYLGRIALARQAWEEALPPLERAITLAPTNAEYQFTYGSASVQRAGRIGFSFKAVGYAKRGRAALEKAVELEPENVLYRQGLIEFYAQAPGIAGGGMDKAYAQVDAIRRVDPRTAALATGNLKFREKKYAEALAQMDPLLAANPDDYQALYFVGRVAGDSGLDLDRGIKALRRCLELTPPPRLAGHAAANFRLGNALLKRGDRSAARAAYTEALRIDPAYTAAQDALTRMGPG